MLLIAGATARAAAFSALRAGLIPFCIDLFADLDLSAVCPVHPIPRPDYPSRIPTIADRFAAGPWLYTGGLENEPELVANLSARRTLWGNDAKVLRQARDPQRVRSSLVEQNIPALRVALSPDDLPCDGTWLVKPLSSAGGEEIHVLDDSWPGAQRPSYFQERVSGPSFAAIFVAADSQCTLRGVTQQLIGRPDAEFAYVGSLGPCALGDVVSAQLQSIGDSFWQSLGLRGLFGVDFILHRNTVWPVEINPRYTASVEVLELAYGHSLMDEHRRVFDPLPTVANVVPPLPRWEFVGKRVLFATAPLQFPGIDRDLLPPNFDPREFPVVADVPYPGTLIEKGEPIMTVFARGSSFNDCEAQLERSLDVWRRRLLL